MRQEQRRILEREHVTVESPWGPIRVKLGRLQGEVVNCAPEFEDCRTIAEVHRRAAQNRSAGGLAPLPGVVLRLHRQCRLLISQIPATPLKVFVPDREIRMSEQREKFYITTPIYYVNARPHIGHTYTTVVCDAIARRQRMLGHDTFFLTGTDEHGQKIERSAAAAGKTPQQLTDEVSGEFRALWDRMGISYDKFIRTTSPEHKRGVQAMFTLLQERGYIYKGSYTGQYCVFDELYADDNTPGTPCPVCGRITETVQEENYFFKLSAMAEPLLKLYEENPGLIYPETRRNEVIAFVKGGLRDLSISRTTFTWGIPVPDDPAHVIYVWLDALCNYVTAVGFGSPDPADQQRYSALLACRRAHDRQRDRALPLRLLAGLPARRRRCPCPTRSWPTAGCSLKRARCPSRAATSCAARPSSKSSAPMLCATSSSAKSSSDRMARSPSTRSCSASTAISPTASATLPAARFR